MMKTLRLLRGLLYRLAGFTGTFPDPTLDEIIEAISVSLDLKIERTGSTYVISTPVFFAYVIWSLWPSRFEFCINKRSVTRAAHRPPVAAS
jgi:hypothetical protein